MKVGSQSPWGKVQIVQTISDDVCKVHTARHGGYKLNRKANMAMPETLRLPGGWYEEDCEWSLVVVGLPHLFDDEKLESAKETLKNWFPDRYEKHFNCTIPEGESYKKDEQAFDEKNKNNWVAVAAFGTGQHCYCLGNYIVPAGKVVVVAALGRSFQVGRVERYFLVDGWEYDQRNHFGFVVDLQKHEELKKNVA